jgi:hypothetical protein
VSHSCSHHDPDQDRYAERARVRGMPEDRELVGTSAYLPFMWPRRLLRPIARQARHQAFSGERTPGHRGLRPARGLGLVLCRRGHSSSLITPRSSSVRYRGSHHQGGARSVANSPKAPDVCPTTHRRPPRCFPDLSDAPSMAHRQYGNEAPGRKPIAVPLLRRK